MTNRALIIGSQVAGLSGVHNDVEAITRRLRSRGFELDVRTGDAASSAGIRTGLQTLIDACEPADIALIYYSGHGARVRNPGHDPSAPGSPRLLQCLVPTDWSDTRFHGLLSLELSLDLAELTAKTRNVTVIVDACHSARMWKGASRKAVARALPRPFEGVGLEGVATKLTELRARDLSSLFPESSPHVVRLVAAEADRSAYELEAWHGGHGVTMGVLTAALCELLDELGEVPITWRALAMLVRERVMFRYELQRPELEGPGQRWVFAAGSASAGVDGGVVYFDDEGEPSLRTGRLLGAELGARYAIMPPGHHALKNDELVAVARITSFQATCARVSLEPPTGSRADSCVSLPTNGALAFLLESPLGKRGVRLHGDEVRLKPLREAIARSRFVTEVETGPLVEVRSVDDALELHAVSGEILSYPTTNTAQMLRALEAWARADLVRMLGEGGLTAPYRVRWGRVVAKQEIRMYQGDTAHVGDKIYVVFNNLGRRPLFFAAFDIGIDGTVTLLTSAEPTGTRVEPGTRYVLGRELLESGMPLRWAETVPVPEPEAEAASLPESILVIVASERHDFSALETGKKGAEAPNTTLGQLLEQIGCGGVRNMQGQTGIDTGSYTVERIDFQLCPRPREP